MATEISCIVRGDSNRYSDCRCITELGASDGRRYSREQAHNLVKQYPGVLYVRRGSSTTDLVPAEWEGLRYVRTAPNDTVEDNLLQLPDC